MKGRLGTRGHLGGLRASFVLWVACLLLSSTVALAAEGQTVQAVLAGDPTVTERITSVLRQSLQNQGLALLASHTSKTDPLDAVRVAREQGPHLPVAYLWLDLTAKPVTLILVETKSHLVYAQTLSVHAEPDEVETELIRFVVAQSLDAILSGSAPGVTPQEFQKSLAPPPATPAEPPPSVTSPSQPAVSTLRWAIGAGYSLSALGTDAIAHGPELSAQLRTPSIHVQLVVGQRLPINVSDGRASVRLLSSAVRLLASAQVARSRGFAMSFGLGAGLDVTRVTPDASYGAVTPYWVSDPLLAPQIGVEQSWGRLLLSGNVGIEWDVLASRYTAVRPTGEDTVWEPSRVRPFAGVGLGYLF